MSEFAGAPDQGALAGVKVLEISHYIAGPHCTMMLADQGADVVKLEPIEGDPARLVPPFSPTGESYGYACHNRGKRSVSMDLRRPEARAALDALLRWADLVVTNYSVGVPERLGFGFERLSAVNPRAVLVHITGYGLTGPRAKYVAFDYPVQAMSGFAHMTGAAEGPPTVSQVPIADHTTAVHAALAAMCALWEQRRTGRGRKVEISMLRTMVSYLSFHVPRAVMLGEAPSRQGNRPSQFFQDMFPTRDASIYVMPLTLPMWRELCALLGAGDWAPADPAAEPEKGERVFELLARWLAERTAAEAMETLQAHRIPCGIARTIAQVYEEELALGSGAAAEAQYESSGERAPVAGPAFTIGDRPGGPFRVPEVGADTAGVLAEAGFDPSAVRSLAEAGVIGGGGPPAAAAS